MEYVVRITDQDLPVLSAALGELPFKIAAPLVERLNRQIAAQVANAEKAGGAPEGAPGGNG